MARGVPPTRKLMLLIGTVKGVFLYHGDEMRKAWRLTGPHLGGWEIFSLCGDTRNGRILAGTGHFMHGPTIRTSTDFGATWTGVKRDPKFPKGAQAELKHIWQIVPGHPSQPETWYAGVDDAALFVSHDDGDTWDELTGLTNHPTRPIWMPGFGGLCLHSVVVDPTNAQRLWVAISAVGVFRSDDAGETWKLCNVGLPNTAPDFLKEPCGRCVHKLVLDPAKPGALTKGLPQRKHFVGVLRDAMTADPLTPSGVYLGTTGGELFYSRNDGDTWGKLPASFPRITTLKTWLV